MNTRSIVRTLFWGVIALLVTIGALSALRWFNDGYRLPPCPIALHADNSWHSVHGGIINIYECEHPDGIILTEWGTWISEE